MKKIPKLWQVFAMFAIRFLSGCAKPVVHEPAVSLPATNQKLTKTQGSTEFDTIRCGLQDKAGNLWFGTTGEGVYQYDKKSFTQYTAQDGLSGNTVWSMMEDRKGRIWFGTATGLSRWDGYSIRPISIYSATDLNKASPPSPNQAPSAQPAVWSLLEEKKGPSGLVPAAGCFVARMKPSLPSWKTPRYGMRKGCT